MTSNILSMEKRNTTNVDSSDPDKDAAWWGIPQAPRYGRQLCCPMIRIGKACRQQDGRDPQYWMGTVGVQQAVGKLLHPREFHENNYRGKFEAKTWNASEPYSSSSFLS
uniref:Uncharacterized protein n=1 Tax=Oryza sativa subsp. japonica TaxID=39947 RepID=Q6K2C8_ORYSJ|nr:hypothetical protein [Oryza sativa Japonica Group]BAD23688.1 hypothetical protein [Oryza sativa Japonica Group]